MKTNTTTARIAEIRPTTFNVKDAAHVLRGALLSRYGAYDVETFRKGLEEATIYVRPSARATYQDALTALEKPINSPAFRGVHVRAFFAVGGLHPMPKALAAELCVGPATLFRRENAGVLYLVPRTGLTPEACERIFKVVREYRPAYSSLVLEITR